MAFLPRPKVLANRDRFDQNLSNMQSRPFSPKILLGEVSLKYDFQTNGENNRSYKSSNFMLFLVSQLTITQLSKILAFFQSGRFGIFTHSSESSIELREEFSAEIVPHTQRVLLTWARTCHRTCKEWQVAVCHRDYHLRLLFNSIYSAV